MSTEQESFLWSQGTTKTYHIPIEHLDYKFIETCTDVKYLEKILKILRSGEEGFYPDLVLFCEKRIETLAPNSRALRREKTTATVSDFTAEEWEKINNEVKVLYSFILICVCMFYICNDFEFSFDVEKECSKIDGNEENKPKTSCHTNTNLPKMEIDTTGMTTKEKNFIANREREKGNEAFVTGDYKEAIAYYVRSISAFPTVASYNNKAQAEIRLQNWHAALQDCETVLNLDPGNIKALMRRATVYNNLQNFKAAAEDWKEVLRIEPDNARAKKNLSDIEKSLKGSEPTSQTQTRGKKIFIQDIEVSDGDEGQGGDEGEDESGGGDKSNIKHLIFFSLEKYGADSKIV
uniref:Sperm-associated antigen 1 n=1 Tax=Varanus komodoensis TaxID=61221 RepID=A0A8D2L3P0_VARKO